MASLLRIEDRPVGDGRRRVVVNLTRPGLAPRRASATFAHRTDEATAERVRWYLEEYAEFPIEPAPSIAATAEGDLSAEGADLFARVFGSGDGAEVWTLAKSGPDGLAGLRVEVDADPGEAPGVAWEVLRDPATDRSVVLSAGEFVRTHHETAGDVMLPQPEGESLRVLLVVARPGGGQDVPFRSVASHLVRGAAERMAGLDLDVLRPPTFARLRQVLEAARDAGRPYHVVHFDGHGTFEDVSRLSDEDDTGTAGRSSGGGSPLRYGISVAGEVRAGHHGYLLFEDPGAAQNTQLVDGPALGRLLKDARVPVLVLNACRSAYSQAQPTPHQPPADGGQGEDTADPGSDVHGRIRAVGSLAAEVADAGVPGVVAMRYNVYVVTAAQFVADLYAHLVSGKSLGQAATAARRALAEDPTRHVAGVAVALQDWVVPTVYEAAPLRLLAPATATQTAVITLNTAKGSGAGGREVGLTATPDLGFYGRDETLLALDRAFDEHRVVLLHAFAGSGKTTTAAEFARWYQATGGLDHPRGVGPVIQTRFEHRIPLSRVLDAVGDTFSDLLAANGIHWSALTNEAERRDVVLQVLAQVPVLWVWDNVEPVTGFPTGTPSAWTTQEQHDLIGFLRAVGQTRCRVLLTSRRDEDAWLGSLAKRIRLPAMPVREGLQLARALAGRHGAGEVDWRPLLRFAGGNPLTITVALSQALRENAITAQGVQDFVARVRAGQAALEPVEDATQGRDRSLAASLTYGFEHAFTEVERAQLAVLHLFRDNVNVDALTYMGIPRVAGEGVVPVLAGFTREAGAALLERAGEIGLLNSRANGFFTIHPALPWYFTSLFTRYHGHAGSDDALRCERGFAYVFNALGEYYCRQFGEGHGYRALETLRAQESNLLRALDIARSQGLLKNGTGWLQGLRVLYDQTGRSGEWAELVAELTPEYVDPATDAPREGAEDGYGVIMQCRYRIAWVRRDWPTAGRLIEKRVAWERERAAPYLNLAAEELGESGTDAIVNLGISLQELGLFLEERRSPNCIAPMAEAAGLFHKVGTRSFESVQAGHLGMAYLDVPALRDLDQAEHWLQQSLDLLDSDDGLHRSASLAHLGRIPLERYKDASRAREPEVVLVRYLNVALDRYLGALDLTPPDHHPALASIHNQLGTIRARAGQGQDAVVHFQESARHYLAAGDTNGAGTVRKNMAIFFANAGRLDEALSYARAAKADFIKVGPGGAGGAAEVERLIEDLERLRGHDV